MRHIAEVINSIDFTQQEIADRNQKQVNVEQWATWFNFRLRPGTCDAAQIEKLVTECAKFCMSLKSRATPYWLTMLGTSGAGKSFLAKRIFRWHRDSGLFQDTTREDHGDFEVTYAREWCWWPKIASMLKSNDGYGIVRDIETAEFAVIDEIGAELDKSGHVTNRLANMLSARVGKWTVITSNKPMADISRDLDPRISSRMIRDGSVVVDVDVQDYSLWKHHH